MLFIPVVTCKVITLGLTPRRFRHFCPACNLQICCGSLAVPCLICMGGSVFPKVMWLVYVSGNPLPRGNEVNNSWNFPVDFLGIVLDLSQGQHNISYSKFNLWLVPKYLLITAPTCPGARHVTNITPSSPRSG